MTSFIDVKAGRDVLCSVYNDRMDKDATSGEIYMYIAAE